MPIHTRSVFVVVACTLLLTTCLGPDATLPHPVTLLNQNPLPHNTALPSLANTPLAPTTNQIYLPTSDARPRATNTPQLPPHLRLLVLQAGTTTITVTADDLGLALPAEAALAYLWKPADARSMLSQLVYNHDRMRAVLERLAHEVDRPAHVQVSAISDSSSRRFVLIPGVHLDVEAASVQIDTWLHDPTSPAPITLTLALDTHLPDRPSAAQLHQQIEELIQGWDGVAGVDVEDLTHAQPGVGVNQDTVFSGASTLKAAILLQLYLSLPTFTDEQAAWMEQMIVDSNNIAADELLAASAGGASSNDAARGAQQLTAMLRDLGLQHTYLSTPYDDENYPIDFTGVSVAPGPDQEGPPPYTVADPYARATPAEMAHLFGWIDACSHGAGILLQRFPDQLTAARCEEMIARLERNGDHTRMMAGLPDGVAVAHKSGWIDDTQADVGIVYAPNGTFLLAVFLYADPSSSSAGMQPALIANLARLVYSYYNPKTESQ